MKSKPNILPKIITLVVVLLIALWMFIIGRGHTIYFDNMPLEYEGQTYDAPYRCNVMINGERAAKLAPEERGSATWVGQNFKMTLEVKTNKGDDAVNYDFNIKLPYNMDGIVLNIPGLLADLPQDAYLSEFVSLLADTGEEEEEIVTDEFSLGDI